jgi:hypothetical protein
MDDWLTGLASESDVVQVDRRPKVADLLEGYVVGVSAQFLMLHLLDSVTVSLNGYTVLPLEYVTRYRVREDSEFFLQRALKLKGIGPKPVPSIDLSNFESVISTANQQFPLVTLHREIMRQDECYIGRVDKISGKAVTLREISFAGTWNRVRRYNFRDITRIDFGGAYEEALAMVAEAEGGG